MAYTATSLDLTTSYSADQTLYPGTRKCVISLDDDAIAFFVLISDDGTTPVAADPEVNVPAGSSFTWEFPAGTFPGNNILFQVKAESGTPDACIEVYT